MDPNLKRCVKLFIEFPRIFDRDKRLHWLADFYCLKYIFGRKIKWINSTGNRRVSPKSIPIKKIICAIENSYGIQIEKEFTPIISDSAGAVWYFGANSSKWIVKIYPLRPLRLKKVEDEMRLYAYLRERGIRVPEILPTKDNRLLTIIKFCGNIFPLVIMKSETQKALNPENVSQEQLQKIGRTIATMHSILKEYPYRNGLEYKNNKDLKGENHLLAIEHLASENSKLLTPGDIEIVRTIGDQLREYLGKYQRQEYLTKSVVHADLHLGQTTFLSDGEVYIFDFDERFYGPVAWDLAISFVHLYTRAKITFEHWERLCKWYLCGYESKMTLKKEDHHAIRLMILYSILVGIHHYCKLVKDKEQNCFTKEIGLLFKLSQYLLTCGKTNEEKLYI